MPLSPYISTLYGVFIIGNLSVSYHYREKKRFDAQKNIKKVFTILVHRAIVITVKGNRPHRAGT